MSARQWQPGDVAMVTWNTDSTPEILFRCLDSVDFLDPRWMSAEDGEAYPTEAMLRPLVVIDPESAEDIDRLAALIMRLGYKLGSQGTLAMQAALREFANPTPPRIAEPGAWGVVEASCVHGVGRFHWMRDEDGNWWPLAPYGADDRRPMPDDWDSLIDPALVREGVS